VIFSKIKGDFKSPLIQIKGLRLLDPFDTQQQIADKFGYADKSKISRFQELTSFFLANIAKLQLEELQGQDLDFLINYKNFVENNLYLYNIWNLHKNSHMNLLKPKSNSINSSKSLTF